MDYELEAGQRNLGSEIIEKDCQTWQICKKMLWVVGNGES